MFRLVDPDSEAVNQHVTWCVCVVDAYYTDMSRLVSCILLMDWLTITIL